MNKDVLCLILTMSDNSEDPERELYKAVVGDVYWHTPIRAQTSSVPFVASFPAESTALHHPHNNDSRRQRYINVRSRSATRP